MDAGLNAVLIAERDRRPPTALVAAFYAEAAYRDGREEDALRLIDLAHNMAEQEIGEPGCISSSPKP